MKDTFNDNSYSEAVKTAHLRFAIIAPVIQKLFTEPTKTAYYKKAAKRPLKMPDSRELYRSGQLSIPKQYLNIVL